MGELFDLTFFLDKKKGDIIQIQNSILNQLEINKGKNMISNHKYPLFSGKEVIVSIYEYDNTEFMLFIISVSDLVFTKKNLLIKVNQIKQIVDICFSQIDAIPFATGIYELAVYFINGIARIEDFSFAILSNHPLLFFREEHMYGFKPTIIDNGVSCTININDGVQDIFANPIRELMEDLGLTFDDAHRMLYGYDLP